MSEDLRALRTQPFAILARIDQDMRAARFEAGEGQFWTGLAFRLGDDYFVIPRNEAGEVLTMPSLTRVPGAADWLLGIANVRGDLLTVCDLRRLAGYLPTPPARETRVIVFNQPQSAMGFVVDTVYGHRQFVPADQKHGVAEDTAPPLRDWLLGAFVREGVSWRVLSLHKLAAAELLTQVAA